MKRPDRYFRAGVGAVILDGNGRVLALERSDFRGAWQLPQGGLKRGESPMQGVLREIEEETGVKASALRLLGRYPELLVYELPLKAQSKKTGMGQVQQWFFFTMKTRSPEAPKPPAGEFRGARWVSFDRVVSGVAPFRKSLYRKLRDHHATVDVARSSQEKT